jgi:CheY-like chemotaxis protein
MRLQQIFWNVLKNAIKFTPDGGTVSLKTSIDQPRARIRCDVTDTGVGLTPGELERIFDAFEQGDHAGKKGSKKFGGLGLGLAIARTLVELHSGLISASSEGIGCGSRFTIELPLAANQTGAVSTVGPVQESAPGPFVPCNVGLRILLVEDHGPTRAALSPLLSRRKHQVSVAATLAEARKRAKAETFDLLITDIGLPDGSGYELMAELGASKNLKGIAMTGFGMEEDIARSSQVGFSAHLTNPVKMQSMDSAIVAAMRQVAPRPEC